MPKYKVPQEEDYSGEVAQPSKTKKTRPHTMYIPMDPDWVKNLSVDEEVEITIKGKVIRLTSNEDKKESTSEVQIGVDTVEYYSEPEESKALEDPEDN